MKNSFIYTILLLLFILPNIKSNAQNKKVQIGLVSPWVVGNELSLDKKNKDQAYQSGFYYILLDFQENVVKEERYLHYAVEILNNEGLESMSDISIDFDPSYQSLTFHEVNIHRKGKIINKLATHEIQTIQRETNHERHLYNGSLTALINLTDVRIDDIIEYSYTIKGHNPVYDGKYVTDIYFSYDVPVERIYKYLILPKQRQFNFKYFNNGPRPIEKILASTKSYTWDISSPQTFIYDSNVPIWYNPSQYVQISEFHDWSDVINWALPLYKLSDVEIKKSKQIYLKNSNSKDDMKKKIISIIRFVQDEVRYLGFESGMNSMKPHNPSEVIKQRFGDCKDKSLLLVSLLKSEGINAHPVLVNSNIKEHIIDNNPSPDVFNHCVTSFDFKNKKYFIDPTINNQGGNLDNYFFPNYKKGLILEKGRSEISDLPEGVKSKIVLNEEFILGEIGFSGDYMVRTEYHGYRADYMRDFFKNNSTERINREYLNFYSSLYPSIELLDEIRFIDEEREGKNIIIVEESYTMDSVWSFNDEGLAYFETSPLILSSVLNFPKTSQRSMPYFIGNKFGYSQKTLIKLFENWSLDDENTIIENDAVSFKNNIQGNGKEIEITFDYKLKKDYIDANEVSNFLSDIGKIEDQLTFFITYDSTVQKSKFSWIAAVFLIISLALGGYLCYWLYFNYDPISGESEKYVRDIGGWLILVAIGISLSPFIQLFDFLITENYFDHNLLTGLISKSSVNYNPNMFYLIMFEMFYNVVFILFTFLIVILFYKKRTSLPRLISFMYFIPIVIIPIDSYLALQLLDNRNVSGSTMNDIFSDVGRSFFAALIWIPYFNLSRRVKETFIYQKKSYNKI